VNIITQFFSQFTKDPEQRKKEMLSDLMRRESRIGREIFGPVPRGGSRDFFCLDENTWIWHESWQTVNGQQERMTRYMVRKKDIVKSVNDGQYQSVSIEEADNLRQAAKIYRKRVGDEVYGQPNKSSKS